MERDNMDNFYTGKYSTNDKLKTVKLELQSLGFKDVDSLTKRFFSDRIDSIPYLTPFEIVDNIILSIKN